MNKFKMKVTAVIGVILLIGIYYYVTLPAINIHASEFWMYLVVLVILAAVVFIRKKNLNRYDWKESKGLKVILGILAVLVIAYVAGAVLSSPIVKNYLLIRFHCWIRIQQSFSVTGRWEVW